MATPRKHWFRVADSMGQDPLSNDELATAIRLMAELNTRWARDGLTAEESCSIVLRPGDLMACTGSGSLARARRIVHALATHISLIVDEQGVNTSIKWPKWAEFQGLTTREQGNSRENNSRESPPPQDAPARRPRKTQDANRKTPESVSAPPEEPPKPKPSKTLCPERLDPEDRESLLAWARSKDFNESEVRWAFNAVKDWSQSKGERRVNWVAAVRNAMRDGWGLKGYRETDSERYAREMASSPFSLLAGGKPDV